MYGTSYKLLKHCFLAKTLVILCFSLAANAEENKKPDSKMACRDQVAAMITSFTSIKSERVILGRQKELQAGLNALERGSDIVLRGNDGSGRTTLVEKLARALQSDAAPETLRNAEVISLNWQNDSGIQPAARPSTDKMPDQILREKVNSLEPGQKLIVHIPDLDLLMTSADLVIAQPEANRAFLAELRNLRREGRILIAGEAKTTIGIEKDPLGRQMQVITINSLTEAEVRQLLIHDVKRIQETYQVSIDESALDAAIVLSKRYFPAEPHPSMPRNLLEQAAIIARNVRQHGSLEKQTLEEQIESTQISLDLVNQNPATFRNIIEQLSADLAKLKAELERITSSQEKLAPLAQEIQRLQNKKIEIEARTNDPDLDIIERAQLKRQLQQIDTQIAEKTKEANELSPQSGVDVDALMVVAAARQRVEGAVNYSGIDNIALARGMFDAVSRHVKGQDEHLRTISRIIGLDLMGLRDPKDNRPRAVIIIGGPTGTGKDFSTLVFHRYMTGGVGEPVVIEGNKLQTELSVTYLGGAEPGYVGYGPGKLTEGIRNSTEGGWIVFTEADKMHPNAVLNIMQLFETGKYEGKDGTVANARGNVVAMTANIGDLYYNPNKLRLFAQQFRDFESLESHFIHFETYRNIVPDSEKAATEFKEMGALSFLNKILRREDGKFTELAKEAIRDEIKKTYPPEVLARVDEIVVYDPLTRSDIQALVEMQFAALKDYPLIKSNKNTLSLSDAALQRLVDEYETLSLSGGARGLKKLVRDQILQPLADAVMDGRLLPEKAIEIDFVNDQFQVTIRE